MNNLSKNILLIILLFAVVFLGIKYYQHLVEPVQQVVVPNIPTQHKDADGTVHTEVKAATDADISFINDYYQNIIQNLTKKIGTKPSAVKDATVTTEQIKGYFKPIYLPDSMYKKGIADTISYKLKSKLSGDSNGTNIYYKDQWLELHGNTNKDSLWSYSVNDIINIVGYEKKTGFLKREIYVDVSTENPHTKIVGFSAVRIQPKPKTWGIGISAGYVFDGNSLKPGISIGLTKTFIRW